jgi:APA family basic amino acid/polyamine antiporter
VLLQQGLALALILTDSFEDVLAFAGITLILFALLTVIGLLRLRRREPDLSRPFRVPLYPLPPLVFILLAASSLSVAAWQHPAAVLACLGLLGAGALALLWPAGSGR